MYQPAPGQSVGAGDRVAPDPGGTANPGRAETKEPQQCTDHQACLPPQPYRHRMLPASCWPGVPGWQRPGTRGQRRSRVSRS